LQHREVPPQIIIVGDNRSYFTRQIQRYISIKHGAEKTNIEDK